MMINVIYVPLAYPFFGEKNLFLIFRPKGKIKIKIDPG